MGNNSASGLLLLLLLRLRLLLLLVLTTGTFMMDVHEQEGGKKETKRGRKRGNQW